MATTRPWIPILYWHTSRPQTAWKHETGHHVIRYITIYWAHSAKYKMEFMENYMWVKLPWVVRRRTNEFKIWLCQAHPKRSPYFMLYHGLLWFGIGWFCWYSSSYFTGKQGIKIMIISPGLAPWWAHCRSFKCIYFPMMIIIPCMQYLTDTISNFWPTCDVAVHDHNI